MRKINVLFIVVLSILLSNCKPNIDYKHQEKPQPVSCPGVDKALLHEALYSFQEDIANYYNFRNYDPKTPVFFLNGYSNFVYKGSQGTAPYNKIISPHTMKVFEALKKEAALWDFNAEGTNLDYHSRFFKNLYENMQNTTVANNLKNLSELNALNPKIMGNTLRTNIRDALRDPHLAMYIALDCFYQYLFDVPLPNAN